MAPRSGNTSQVEEAALSAIEEELSSAEASVNKPDDQVEGTSKSGSRAYAFEDSDSQAFMPSFEEVSNDTIHERRRFVSGAGYVAQRQAQKYAFLFSLVWSGLTVGIGAYFYGTELIELAPAGGVSSLVLLAINLVITGLPIVVAYSLGSVLGRIKSVEISAGVMNSLAQRFVDPESFSRDSLVSIGQAVKREVLVINDSIDRAVARASELTNRIQHEIAVIENASSENELKVRALVNDLKIQGEMIVSNGQAVRDTLDEVQRGINSELSGFENQLKTSSENAITAVEMRVGSVQEEFVNTIDDVIDRSNRHFDEREKALREQFEQAESNINRTIISSGDSVTDSFRRIGAEVSEELSEKAADIKDTLNETRVQMVETLDNQKQDITSSLYNVSQEIVGTINDTLVNLTDNLKITGDSIFVNISLRSSDMTQRLEEAGSRLSDSLESTGVQAVEKLDAVRQTLSESINSETSAMSAAFTTMLDDYSDKFRKNTELFSESVVESFGNAEAMWLNRLNEYAETISLTQSDMLNALESKKTEFNSEWREKADSMTTDLDQISARFTSSLETNSHSIRQLLSGELDQFEDIIEATGEKIQKSNSAMVGAVDAFNTSLDSRLSAFSTSVGNHSAALSETLSSEVGRLSDDMASSSQAILQLISGEHVKLSGTLDRVRDSLLGDVRTAGQDMVTLIEDSSDIFGKAMNTRIDSLGEIIEAKTSHTVDHMTNLIDRADKALSERSTTVIDSMSEKIDSIEEIFSVRLASTLDTIDQSSQSTFEKLVERASEAGELLQSHSLGAAEALKERAEDINAVLSLRSAEFANLLMDKRDELGTAINDIRDHTLGALNIASNTIYDEISKGALDAAEKLTSTHETIRGELGDAVDSVSKVVERVYVSSGILKEILVSANDSLGLLEGQMKHRSENLRNIMETSSQTSRESTEALSKQVGAMREISGTVLVDIADLARNLDGHANSLTNSADTLERANLRVEARLSQQQSIVSEITDNLITKIEDMDTLIKGVASMIDESMMGSEKRVGSLAENVQLTANTIASQVEQELRKLYALAEAESSQVSSLVKGVYDSLGGEISKIGQTTSAQSNQMMENLRSSFDDIRREVGASLRETTNSVSSSAEQLEGVARNIQRELTETREEIKRSIDELPAEAKASTKAVRQLVNDQIQAFRNLTSTVDKSGALFGAMPPSARHEGWGASAPVADNRGANSYSSSQRPARESSWMSQVLDRAESNSQPARPSGGDFMSRERGDIFGRSQGYASQPVAEPVRRSGLGGVDIDMARAVDDDAVNDLWLRFRRGERNLFSRRLYTLAGQSIYDEVVERYQSDTSFQRAVDKFINDFEQLIGETSRKPGGEEALHKHLVSDAGKVYTLLRHASNRKS